MATNNAINANQAGLVRYDGAGNFTGVTVTQNAALVGAASNGITSVTGTTGTVLIGNTGSAPSFSATPTLTNVTFGSGTALGIYQQGSFTPGLSFGNASVGIVYVNQIGQYTQIGNVFFFSVLLQISNKGSSTGTARITNFPITTISTETAIMISSIQNLTLSANFSWAALTTQGATSGAYALIESGSIGGYQLLTNTSFANNTRIAFDGFFFA